MDCSYCKEEKNIIYKTKYWKILLSSEQSYLGRCRIILNRHCSTLSELKKEEWTDFSGIVGKLESALEKSFDATMFNWTCMMNHAYLFSPPNPHVHWHSRPRYNHSVKFAGLAFEDPEFGKHYDRARKREVTEEVMRKIIEKIKENL